MVQNGPKPDRTKKILNISDQVGSGGPWIPNLILTDLRNKASFLDFASIYSSQIIKAFRIETLITCIFISLSIISKNNLQFGEL